jgi:hypothetical protein
MLPAAPAATILYVPVVPTVHNCTPLGMVCELTVFAPVETVTVPIDAGMETVPYTAARAEFEYAPFVPSGPNHHGFPALLSNLNVV